MLPSDKGNRLTVSTTESFARQGDGHTVCDRKISTQELEQTQTRLNNLSRSLCNIFKVGSHWGDRNTARCWGNAITDSCIAPLLYPSPKTHKDLDISGDPKSRPIVQASSCITSRPAEILSDILEGALKSFPTLTECQSTEDMLVRVDKANVEVRARGKDVCVGSGDAVALYPSLKHKLSARLCAEVIRTCPANIDSVDYRMAAVFIATHCTSTEIKEAGLQGVIPARKHKNGQYPTPATPELRTRSQGDQSTNESKFRPTRTNLTEHEKKLLTAKVIEVGVITVIRNHVYKWKDELWLQSLGVPTGLRLSGLIGRITMDHWMVNMNLMMKDNNMVSFLTEKYVDDCEVVLENVPVGARWVENKLQVTEEMIEEDKSQDNKRDMITMRVWESMASSIVPGLQFTTDYCSKNPSGTVAMLDFQLWKTTEEDPDNPGGSREALRYTFYEKPMSNVKVLDEKSAMPHRVKISSLTQEGVRRLCNVSKELDDSHKCKILSRYMWKLKLSGYQQRTRANILESAVNTFRKKERAEVLGVQ